MPQPTEFVWRSSSLRGAILLAIGALALQGPTLRAQPAVQGRWQTLPYTMPINPVHIALVRSGQVLIVAGSGNVATETNYRAAVWDPASGTIQTQPLAWDMFCNGMVILPDGRPFINGGNLQYDPFHGQPRNAVFDPMTRLFTDVQDMAHGRWYPTATTLGDGRVMTFSGLNETGGTNTAVEIYTPGTGWSAEYPAGWTPPLYPRMHLLTDGTVLYSGSGTGSRIFNPTTLSWSGIVATTNYATTRTYGTSVLLPLKASDGYRARVMIMGGGNPATATTEILDLSAAPLRWQNGPPMSQPRIEMNATILPNGKVLALGGSRNDEDAATASLNADLYSPNTNTFSPAGANAFPRLYHSGSLLLPDATVLLVGGNPTRGSYEARMEIYSPAYLFNSDGTPASRPIISTVTPGAFGYGSSFHVQTPDAADVRSVVLARPGAQTHAFDMDQRLVELSFTTAPGDLTITAPPNGNIAPPGYYLLFILNSSGVPSVAAFVQLSASAPNQRPTATISSPAGNPTVDAGQSVFFAGTGTDSDGTISAYAWSFPGGSPASATVATPGNVTYSTPGSYMASLTVTDNGGLTSLPVTRTVLVPNFTVTATPAARTVAPGSATSYTATVTAGTGFISTVNFSVSGLPTGASATFTPNFVTGSGSSTLNVSTGSSTPAGSYPIVISGTSGQLTRTTTVTLVVAPNFSISVTPTSQTVARGESITYTVTVTGGSGFSGRVDLSVDGIPKFATATFSPTSIQTSGTSVLTVSTKKQGAKGSSDMTISGSSSGAVRSVTATIVMQ